MTEYFTETIFTWGAPQLKFGIGAIDELGHDVGDFGMENVLIVTDPGVAETGIPERIRSAMVGAGLKVDVYDGAHVEPTDESLREAVEYASDREWDGFVAVGGGSSIDTAKAINLMTTYPVDDLMEYVNPPIGDGKAPGGPVKPLIAVPTTAGTGSESTAVCIMDIISMKVKSGISHPRLRPSMAIVDPLVTLSLMPGPTSASGVDILCHALESYTAKPYYAKPRTAADARVAYNGANPVSDVFSEKAMELLGKSFRKAVLNGNDLEARSDMALAATFAGMGFGNAGVHIPHGCAYPIAGQVKEYHPKDYPPGPLVPHGQSVGVTAPASFRFTYPTNPERHLRAAELLGADLDEVMTTDYRELLPETIIALFRDIDMPNGIAELGYDEDDIPQLVDGAMKQQRILTWSPRPVAEPELTNIFIDSLTNW